MEKNINVPKKYINLSGLEEIRQRIGLTSEPPIFKTMCMKITKAEKGYVELEAVPDYHHLNIMGVVQGGVTASILDAVTGCTIQTILEPGAKYTTIDLNVKYIKPVKADGTILIAEGQTINVSNRIGIAQGTLKDKSGTLYAYASASCIIFRETRH